MSLATLVDVKTYLGETSTDFDAFLTLQLGIVSDAIELYCNRKFLQANYVQTFYSQDFYEKPREFRLHHYPVSGTPVVKEITDAGEETLSDIRCHKQNGLISKTSGGFFTFGPSKIQVEYTAGYAELPSLIKSVLFGLVEERYNKKINGVDMAFGADVQRIAIAGAISIDFDYSLQHNERKTHLGVILGNYINVLDSFRSDRAVIGEVRPAFVE